MLDKKRPGQSGVWEFELTFADGLTPIQGNGSRLPSNFRVAGLPIRLVSADGTVAFEIPAGVATDAAGAETGVDLDLRWGLGDRWIVAVSVDSSWLNDKARTFPVEIDPTIVIGAPAGGNNATSTDGVIYGFHPYTSDMISDQYFSYGTRNLLMKFDLSSIPAGSQINFATLNTHVSNCDAPYAWSPYAFNIYASALASPYGPGIPVPAAVSSIGLNPGGYGNGLPFNVTQWVQNWTTGAWGNQGVKFEMERYAYSGQPNYCNFYVDSLVVDATLNLPPTGSITSPTDNQTNVALQPTFTASASDPEGQPLLYYFLACSPSLVVQTTCWQSDGWISSNTWTLPSALGYFTDAAVDVWAYDGVNSVRLGRAGFKTIPRPNGAPNITSITGPAPGSTGNSLRPPISAVASDPNNDPLEYRFWYCLSGCPAGGSWDSGWIMQSSWVPTSDLPWGAAVARLVQVRDVPPAGTPSSTVGTSPEWVGWFNTLLRPNQAPPAPDLSVGSAATPAAGAVNTSNRPSFSVPTPVDPDGDPVRIQYSVCPASGPCVVSGFVYGSWQPAGVAYNTAYTWAAQAEDVPPPTAQGSLRSAVSATRSFTTGANPANGVTAPLADAPLGTSAVPGAMSNRPILQAKSGDADGDPFEYQFVICSPSLAAPSAQCFTSSWRSAPHWQVTGYLDWGATYEWKAFARNVSDPAGNGVSMVTSQFAKVSVQSADDVISGVAGFNPYVEVDGANQDGGGVSEGVGQLTYATTDVNVPSVPGGLQVKRTYNGRLRTKGAFGRGWTSNLDARIVFKANYANLTSALAPVEVILPDGRREYFSRNASGIYVSATPGFFSELRRDASNNFVYLQDDLSTFLFDANGLLREYADRNGNKLTYTYTGTAPNQVLDQITDAKSGRSLTFAWLNGKVQSVKTVAVAAHGGQLSWTYNHTGDNLEGVCPPASASPPVSGCWGYVWSGERLVRVVKPGGNTELEVNYDAAGFTLNAPNKAPNPSFEDAAVGWVAGPGASAIATSTTDTTMFGAKALKGSLESGKPIEALSPLLDVDPNTTYSLSAYVKSTTAIDAGLVIPYWQGFDAYGAPIVDTNATTGYSVGGSALREGDTTGFSTPNTWSPIRGSFRTSENAKKVKISFKWASPAAPVVIDAVLLVRGDGLTNRVAWRKDGRGFQTNYSYLFAGTNIVVTKLSPRPGAGTTVTTYNDQLRLLSTTDQTSAITSYGYDANGFVNTVTDPQSRVTRFENDVRGNVTKRTWEWLSRSEYTTYKPSTNLIGEFRDARSSGPADNTYRVLYDYDAAGNRTKETDPTGAFKVWAYTQGTETGFGGTGLMPKGRLSSSADRSGLVVNYSYDAKGDLREVNDPATGIRQFTLDEIGRTTTDTRIVSGAAYSSTTRQYDVRSRVTVLTGPQTTNIVSNVNHRAVVTTSWDANNNPGQVTVSDAVGGDVSRATVYNYDADDRLKKMTEPGGRITNYDYDEDGNRVLVTDPRGVRIRTSFDPRGLVSSEKMENFFDAPGGATREIVLVSTVYDSLRRASTKTDAVGRVTAFAYWPDDRLKSTTRNGYVNPDASTRNVEMSYAEYDNVGNVLVRRQGGVESARYEYDSRNFLRKQYVDPAGLNRLTTFDVDAEGRLLQTTTGRNWQKNTLDPASKLVRGDETSGVGAAVTYGYDTLGRMTSSTDERSFVTNYVFDQLDRRTTTQRPTTTVWTGGTSASSRPTEKVGYNTFGEPTHSSDPRALNTVVTRNTLGQSTKVTYPTQSAITPTESMTYDLSGNVTSVVDRRGQTTNLTIDAMGRTRVVTQPAPVAGGSRPTISTSFDDASQVTQSVDPNGVVTNATWDLLGRQRSASVVVRQKANAEWKTLYEYNDAGRRIKITDPLAAVLTQAYNGAGQPTVTTDPASAQTTVSYEEPMGWPAEVNRASRTRTRSTFDDAGRIMKSDQLSQAGTVMATTQWGFDFASNKVTQTRPNGAVDTWAYDELNRMKEAQTRLTATTTAKTTIGYDAASNAVRLTDPRSYVTTSSFNNWNLPAGLVEPSTTAHPAATDRTWSYTYGAAGDLTTEAKPGGVNVTRSYDLLGRLASESGTGTGVTTASRTFSYDPAGRLTAAGSQTFTYFDTGALQSSAGPSGTASFDIDAAGRMVSRTDAAGTSTFTYTPRGEMKTYDAAGAGVVTLSWTGEGNVNDVTYPAGVTRTFGYDEMGRVIDDKTVKAGATLSRREYGWNLDSSVKSTTVTQPGNTAAGAYTYTYDLGSRLTQVAGPAGAATYAWDLAGNRTSAGGVASTFDERNRLTSVGGVAQSWSPRGTATASGGVALTFDGLDRLTGAGAATYAYDGLNRVASRTQGGTSSTFAYAGLEPDPVADGASLFARGPGGEPLGLVRSGVKTLVGADRHGDVGLTLNPASGAVTDSVVRDPFGKVLGSSGSQPSVGFQGDWTDPGSGLVWMGARWFSPTTGGFVSRDRDGGAAGVPLSVNRYLYGLSDPLRYTDPTGRRVVPFPDGGGSDNIDDETGCTTRTWSSGASTSWCPEGPITTSGSTGTSVLYPDGSSSRTSGSGVTVDSPAPVVTGAYTTTTPQGGSVTCTAASTAGGFGRTCFFERPDGGFGVVGATGFRALDMNGRLQKSGPIDRRDYDDLSNGTANVAEAAAYLASGADYADAAARFDRSGAATALEQFLASTMDEMRLWGQENRMGKCGGPTGNVCYLTRMKTTGPRFASKVGPGRKWDVKEDPELKEIYGAEKYVVFGKYGFANDTWGNILYGWLGRLLRIREGDLMDASHGSFDLPGPFNKRFDAGLTTSADDVNVRSGFDLYKQCGFSCSAKDLLAVLDRNATKVVEADRIDGTRNEHIRKFA